MLAAEYRPGFNAAPGTRLATLLGEIPDALELIALPPAPTVDLKGQNSALDLDTTAPLHHSSSMRLTINLDDDLYAMARTHAVANHTSLSKAVGDLLRRKISSPPAQNPREPDPDTDFFIDPETLLPVVRGDGRVITMEAIQRAIDDDDLRVVEAAGWIQTADRNS